MSKIAIYHDPGCTTYGASHHPERPQRILGTEKLLKSTFPDAEWRGAMEAEPEDLLRAHPARYLERLEISEDFDPDTPHYRGIPALARLAAGHALAAMRCARKGMPAFSLMRPPGHHATRTQAMGFCYLSNVAIAALAAIAEGCERVAIFDFDVHHGNGTEAVVLNHDAVRFASVHQSPCYPGTGLRSLGNARNEPLPPHTRPELHMQACREALDWLSDWKPGLLLVSAGFDAYRGDPLAQMSLGVEDFHTLGRWVRETKIPAASVLEGGYSNDLPELIRAYLRGLIGSPA